MRNRQTADGTKPVGRKLEWPGGEKAGQTAEALQENQALLQAAFSIETVGVLFFNLDGGIVDANAAFERMCGYTRDELRAIAHWGQLTPREFWDATAEVAARLAKEGRTPPYEKQMIRKDGTRWWGLFAPTRFAGSGSASKCVEVILDIDDRRRAQEALRVSEERFRTLFEAIDEGFALCELIRNADGKVYDIRVAELNPAFERMSGLRRNIVFGRRATEAFPNIAEECIRCCRHASEAGVPVRGDSYFAAYDRWYDVRLFPRGNDKLIVLYNDITMRKRAEATLQASEQRQTFLVQLDDVLRPLSDATAICREAARVLCEHLGADRAIYTEAVNADELEAVATYSRAGMPGKHRDRYRISDYGPELAAEFQAGRISWRDDIATDPRLSPAEKAAYAALRCNAWANAPLVKDGRLVAMLSVHYADAHAWSHDELTLLEEAAERTWAAVERAKAESALRYNETRTRALMQASSNVLYTMSADWKELGSLSGGGFVADSSHPTGNWLERYVHPDDRPQVQQAIDHAIRTKSVFDLEHRVICLDGSLGWTHSRAVPIVDENGEIREWFGAATDITERKLAEEKVRRASLHDALTGLPNRAMLFEYASRLLPHNRRTRQHAALLFFDLDRFKPINDTHGHEVGDAVLKEVAARLAGSVRTEDIVARLGGDEFVILFPEIKDTAAAAEIARHIIELINTPYHVGELKLCLSTSVGISMFPGDGQDVDTLISHADLAMYQAKQAGRNDFKFYSAEHSARSRLQLDIEQKLKNALNLNALSLCYQPVVDVESGNIVSVEALLRLRNCEVGPAEFIPVAEATGVINPIGRWLLREASRQYKSWLGQGLPPIPIAVNVSVVEFRDRDFAARFEETLHEYGIGTDALQLEVTETAVMDDIEHAVAMLSRLKELGVKILLDDFGTGHSSLAYLVRLPLSKVKIDKSFVAPLERDSASRVVADAMIALGHTLKLDVVAEGVESEAVLRHIRSNGCGQAQGYYLGRPMPGDAFEHWYRHNLQACDRGGKGPVLC